MDKLKRIILLIIIILTLLSFAACANSAPKETLSPDDRELLARLVYLEAGAQSLECQKAVASVVLNQLDAGYWGDTIEEVIYYPNNYSPVHLIATTTPDQEAYDAVDAVLTGGRTLPPKVCYFRADYDHSWPGYTNYTVIDNVYFGYFYNKEYH